MTRKKNDLTLLQRARQVFSTEINALQRVRSRLTSSFEHAVHAMQKCVENGHKIITTGMGKSGHIAAKVAATLTSTGSPAVFLDCANAIHGDLGLVSEGDCVLLFSYSGTTEEIVRLVPLLKRPGVTLVALSGRAKSPLVEASDYHLDVSVKSEACPLNLAPTASTTAMLAMGDALAMTLMQARGVTRELFARLHPGGAIGRALLLRVSDIMRTGQHMAALPHNVTVLEALEAMHKARSGAAVLLNPSGTLAGIFTHGDFARHYSRDTNIGTKKVSAYMTKKPIVVRDTALAVDALNIFEKHNIDDLIVIDQHRRPVGVVDAQDLTKHHLIQ
jgi:arabinose-5-phosphate isomerase